MYISTLQLAEMLQISPRTLERWRVDGNGPQYMKAGRRVLYDRSEIESWLSAGIRFSTSAIFPLNEGELPCKI